jgi:hypothetical protein
MRNPGYESPGRVQVYFFPLFSRNDNGKHITKRRASRKKT